MLRLHCKIYQVIRNSALSAHMSSTMSNDSQLRSSTDVADKDANVEEVVSKGKQPARPPLLKNFFAGVVDRELLAYPEVICREEMNIIENELMPIRNYFVDEIDTRQIDSKACFPEGLLENIQQLGLFSINVPKPHGKGWEYSESLMISEPETNCTDVALNLLSHRVVIDILNEVGTDDQKNKFLPKLASGDYLGTEAVFESKIPENNFFNTTATSDDNNENWTVSGEKAYVVSGPLLKGGNLLMLVIAETQRSNLRGDAGQGTTLFLIDSTSKGVNLIEQTDTIGCRGTKTCRVEFKNVLVPGTCVIGDPHEGSVTAEKILRSGRLRSSMIGLGLMKNITNSLSKYCLENKQCGIELKDLDMMKVHLAEVVCSTYAIESMIYMTAGYLDEFDQQDLALEAAVTRYFTLTHLMKSASKAMDIMGPLFVNEAHLSDMALRNAIQLYTQSESMDTLRLFIALTGLQHAGVYMNENVNKSRNPLFHPGYIFSKLLSTSNIDNPKTKMYLADNLHPSLASGAQCIEHSVARLQMSVELSFTRYGREIIHRHNEINRLAEVASIIYAMFASISRASRSYCIGLHLADNEMLIASTICSEGRERIKVLCTEIFNGEYLNNDNIKLRLGKQVIKNKKYFPVHPLTYNF